MQQQHDALVLLMTDGKDVQHEIECLEAGADDYLRKPFFPSQLLARIRALSRRGRSTLKQRPFSVITVGPICVDSLHNEVTVNGKSSRLTPTEGKLLHCWRSMPIMCVQRIKLFRMSGALAMREIR